MAKLKRGILWDGKGDFNEARRKFYDSLTEEEFLRFAGVDSKSDKAMVARFRRGKKSRDRRNGRKAA